MSDIRKFMNIVESVSEDATSPDVGTTDSESSEKISNQMRMTIALHNLLRLVRFIKGAQEASRLIRKTALKIFVNRADIFIKEAHAIVNEVSGKEYSEPNIRTLINKVNLITPYDSTPIFRTEKGQFGSARSSEEYIQMVVDAIEKGVDLIAFKSGDENKAGFLLMIQLYLKNNKEFLRLNNLAKTLIPEVKSDLEEISHP